MITLPSSIARCVTLTTLTITANVTRGVGDGDRQNCGLLPSFNGTARLIRAQAFSGTDGISPKANEATLSPLATNSARRFRRSRSVLDQRPALVACLAFAAPGAVASIVPARTRTPQFPMGGRCASTEGSRQGPTHFPLPREMLANCRHCKWVVRGHDTYPRRERAHVELRGDYVAGGNRS